MKTRGSKPLKYNITCQVVHDIYDKWQVVVFFAEKHLCWWCFRSVYSGQGAYLSPPALKLPIFFPIFFHLHWHPKTQSNWYHSIWAFKCNVMWHRIFWEANFISHSSLNCHFSQILPSWVIFCLPQSQDLASPSMLQGSFLSFRYFPSLNLRCCFPIYVHGSSLSLRNFPSPYWKFLLP